MMSEIDPIITAIQNLAEEKKSVVIAIDGKSASGKTRLAAWLSSGFDSCVIHMDHFFLPRELRTKERFAEPGGNIHYERFSEEVADQLMKSEFPFRYNVFDCRSMKYNGIRTIWNAPLIIVEGTYCLRPEFRDLYDLKIFLDIDAEEQKRRIIARDGEGMWYNFANRWIPMERIYFQKFDVANCCDLIKVLS